MDGGSDGADLLGGYAGVLVMIGRLAPAVGVYVASEARGEARMGWPLLAAGGFAFLGGVLMVASRKDEA